MASSNATRWSKKQGKKTWILFAEEGYPPDKPPEQLDLPPDAASIDPAAYQTERRRLQDAVELLKADVAAGKKKGIRCQSNAFPSETDNAKSQ